MDQCGRGRFLRHAGILALGVAGGHAGVAMAQERRPTPTPQAKIVNQPDSTDQSLPGPTGDNLFDWLCAPGPFGPWHPLIAPPEVTALTDIRWYGLQMDDANKVMTTTAFHRDGQEISSGVVRRGPRGEVQWAFSGDSTRVEGSFSVEPAGSGAIRIAGEIADHRLRIVVANDGTAKIEGAEVPRLDTDQERLLAQWSLIAPKLEGLLDVIAAPDDGSSVAGPTGCFVSGMILAPSLVSCAFGGLLGCAGVVVSGGYILNNCED